MEIKNTHATKTWILSRVYSQTPWLIIKERDTYPPVTSYHGVRRSGTPHILIQGTRQVIYSDLSSVLVIESRHGTNWEWTQAHSSVGYEPKTTNLRNERHCEGSTQPCATIFESIRLSQNPSIGETDTSFGCQYYHQVIKTTPGRNAEDFSQPLRKESVDQGRLWSDNQASLSSSPKTGIKFHNFFSSFFAGAKNFRKKGNYKVQGQLPLPLRSERTNSGQGRKASSIQG